MSYLVDGNNLMALSVGWHKDKRAARRRLLDELARFADTARKRLSVVFDGAPDEFFADGSSYMGVSLYYARQGADADARIKEIVEASRERRTLHVITSDRALGDYVRRCGASVIKSSEFRRRMNDANAGHEKRDGSRTRGAPPSSEENRGAVKKGELESWMRYFGVDATDED